MPIPNAMRRRARRRPAPSSPKRPQRLLLATTYADLVPPSQRPRALR